MALLLSPNRAALRREWASQTRARASLQASLTRAAYDEIARAGNAAAAGFEASGDQGVTIALEGHQTRLEALLMQNYRRTFAVFGERILEDGKSFGVIETKDAENIFARFAGEWIRRWAATKATMIAETTLRDIQAAILEGVEEGDGIAGIARPIRNRTVGMIGRARANVIARTETHAASQAAQDEALGALGRPDTRREWVAAFDGRTRESHRVADGQTRRLGDTFDVGGAKLKYPGDPDGPPQEIIMCRCIAAAVIGD